MHPQVVISDKILDVVRARPDCDLDHVVAACGDLGLNEVFFELDRLTRVGELSLCYKGNGRYTVRVISSVSKPAVSFGRLRRRLLHCPEPETAEALA